MSAGENGRKSLIRKEREEEGKLKKYENSRTYEET